MTPSLSPLVSRVIDAYGGEARWRQAKAVECQLSAHGWAFRMKLRPAMKEVSLRARVSTALIEMEPWGRAGRKAVLEGGSVRIEENGGVIERRDDARRFFPGGRQRFRWDDLDQAYFAGYAAWNYITFPALLLRPDIECEERGETTIEARFPDSLPTHSPVQQFHFDAESGLLRQHDYTAEVFGDWATAANVVLKHDYWDGVPYPSRRRVTPRKSDGSARPFPLLVGIEIRNWRLV